MKIELDMYQTLAAAVVVLMLGRFLRGRIRALERFCIPAPVIGGVLFAIFTCVCYVTGLAEFGFDDVLKEVCMVFFFTSVGFQANLKVLKSGGKSLILFLGLVVLLIVSQNLLGVQLAKLLGLSPLLILLAGQTLLMLVYVVVVVFNVMGRDYDAAVIVSGVCGFGMGATPNAMANMQVVCEKYAPSVKAYLLIPLVGSLFADFLNSLVITLFINLI